MCFTGGSRELREYFWAALESFTDAERSLFLTFVWGRSSVRCGVRARWTLSDVCAQLPSTESEFDRTLQQQSINHFEVIVMGGTNQLPVSHTCFFKLDLPPYETQEKMTAKLKYAIHHCKAIDADFNAHAGFVIHNDDDE
eukprot:Unigene6107_Nuclearia_a/m.18743 Unigene6107_Nuclearia_a/g.18743  ORF Unigene6107_Nuclearia_a/g.18743 Unigene6107_Nuclearia_a/m.18743 type:complete len:140 (-) Unigene6107_Nuclearia_a:83-502(-)